MVRFARQNDTWSTNIGWKWQFCQLARNFLKLAQSHLYCWAPRVWVACVGMVLSHALWCYQHSWKMQQRTKALYLRCFSGSEARKMKRSGYRFVSEALKLGVRWSSDCEDMYSCAVSLGGLSSVQAFRLATRSKHHGLTFLSSVSAERDKSGLPAALAASRYLVTFQTVGVGGLSQARPGWEGNRGQVIHYCPGARLHAYGFNISLPRVMSHPHPQTHTWLMQNDRPTAGGFGPTVFSLFCEWVWGGFFSPLALTVGVSPSPTLSVSSVSSTSKGWTAFRRHANGPQRRLPSWPISMGKARWPGYRSALAFASEACDPEVYPPRECFLSRRTEILRLYVTLCGFS